MTADEAVAALWDVVSPLMCPTSEHGFTDGLRLALGSERGRVLLREALGDTQLHAAYADEFRDHAELHDPFGCDVFPPCRRVWVEREPT